MKTSLKLEESPASNKALHTLSLPVLHGDNSFEIHPRIVNLIVLIANPQSIIPEISEM